MDIISVRLHILTTAKSLSWCDATRCEISLDCLRQIFVYCVNRGNARRQGGSNT